ncbi:MAG: ABC transporter permease subunit, partial [Frankiaceae bacterium]|nr:ABC transporter permease subunit [Frankiaceae bacterium]
MTVSPAAELPAVRGAAPDAPAPPPAASEPRPIKAVGAAHPWRWAGGAVAAGVLGLFGYDAAHSGSYRWDLYGKYIFDERISRAALSSLELTGIAAAVGLVLGVGLAVLRVGPNPVLKTLAGAYIWFFRAIPLFVQLLFWGLFPVIYGRLDIGVPFAVQIWHLDVHGRVSAFALAAIGLSLYSAAALAQAARAGLLSLDRIQPESAAALGMTRAQSMRRVVLPQAARAMAPVVGQEIIALVQATSLVVAIPLTSDLLGRSGQIGRRIDAPVPLLLVAATWYLAISSILMIVQV